MKKKISLALSFICCSLASHSQPLLSSSNSNPVIGNSFVTFNCDTSNIFSGNAGSNITWDFSTLVVTSADTGTVVSCSSTANCSDYAGSSYAIVSNATDVVIYNIDNDTIKAQDGYYASASSNVIYTTPIEQIHYPFSYDSTFSAPYAGIITFGGSSAHETGTITVTADGYGMLILPGGVVDSNVLRIHSIQVFADSVDIFGVSTGASFQIETYSWYMANYHSPLLAIGTTTQVGGGNTNKIVSFSEGVTAGAAATPEIYAPSSALEVYPNPVAEALNINFTPSAPQRVRITLSDMLGREIAVIADDFLQSAKSMTYNTTGLAGGIYLLHVTSGETNITRKIEVE